MEQWSRAESGLFYLTQSLKNEIGQYLNNWVLKNLNNMEKIRETRGTEPTPPNCEIGADLHVSPVILSPHRALLPYSCKVLVTSSGKPTYQVKARLLP